MGKLRCMLYASNHTVDPLSVGPKEAERNGLRSLYVAALLLLTHLTSWLRPNLPYLTPRNVHRSGGLSCCSVSVSLSVSGW